MDLFEYQGKQYFARYGIPVSPGAAVDTVEEAVAAAERIGYPVVVKAQVQVGGRGKAGGIKLANNAEETRLHATNILGMSIKGHIVRRVWIELASDIKTEPESEIRHEYYASFTLDRSAKKHLGMLSREGGIDIEEVADRNPLAIKRIHIDPADGLSETICRAWVRSAGLAPEAEAGTIDILMKLYRCYVDGDADLVEINPLILTPDNIVRALDAKVTLDDSAAEEHPEWDEFRGLEQLDEREKLAKEKDLQYVGLDGSVGIIANGAGLAMSTVDIVNQVGGKPANFLDIGGGANAQVMVNALTVINTDPNVKVIFINIFGGITRCDEVARGIIEASSLVTGGAPIIVRLDGTNAVEGRALIQANLSNRLQMAPDMLTAARKAVVMAG